MILALRDHASYRRSSLGDRREVAGDRLSPLAIFIQAGQDSRFRGGEISIRVAPSVILYIGESIKVVGHSPVHKESPSLTGFEWEQFQESDFAFMTRRKLVVSQAALPAG